MSSNCKLSKLQPPLLFLQANVGGRVKEPQFIRALMTAICESAIHSKSFLIKRLLIRIIKNVVGGRFFGFNDYLLMKVVA